MQENPEEQETERLYQRFKQSLSDREDMPFFDEDDLVAIYDYAGDYDDDYVRLEVLFYAARYYPDSMPLSDRRAIYYQTYSDDMRDSYLFDNTAQESLIMNILRLRALNPQGEEARRLLDGIVERFDNMDDEEVIQLADAASAIGQVEWLIDRIDVLRGKTDYLATLLYEMDVVFEMNNRYDLSRKVLEELTMIEPFNVDMWRLMAQCYLKLEEYAEGISAIEYALAIDPSDRDSLVIKAELLFRADRQKGAPEAAAILEPIVMSDYSNIDMADALLQCYVAMDDTTKIAALVDLVGRHVPESEWVVNCNLIYNPDNVDKVLADFAATGEKEESIWIKLANTVGEIDPRIAVKVMAAASGNTVLADGWEVLMQYMYELGDYSGLLQMMAENANNPDYTSNFSPEMTYMLAKSLIEVGMKNEARIFVDNWNRTCGKNRYSPSEKLHIDALSHYIEFLFGGE